MSTRQENITAARRLGILSQVRRFTDNELNDVITKWYTIGERERKLWCTSLRGLKNIGSTLQISGSGKFFSADKGKLIEEIISAETQDRTQICRKIQSEIIPRAESRFHRAKSVDIYGEEEDGDSKKEEEKPNNRNIAKVIGLGCTLLIGLIAILSTTKTEAPVKDDNINKKDMLSFD